MTAKSPRNAKGALRRRAEQRLRDRGPDDVGPLSPEATELIHELQVHQMELELQNEALREAQTAQETARDEAVRSEARYRELYDLGPVAYLTLDPSGRILDANESAASLLATTRDDLRGCAFSDFVGEKDQDSWYLGRRELTPAPAQRSFELCLERRDGHLLHSEVVAHATEARAHTPPCIELAVLDVTDRERARRERRQASRLAARVEQRERRKLAEELHDDVGQTLSLTSVKLAALAAARRPEEIATLTAELSRLVDDAREKVSSLSFQLSPSVLYDVGLVAAVQWLADEMERLYRLRVLVAPAEEIDELDETTRGALFRALREFLVNVAKHSRADVAEVRIRREGDFALVEVEDRGVGFDPASVKRGFGLLSVRERIEQLGGRVEIHAEPGDGTHIHIRIPTRASEADEGAGI